MNKRYYSLYENKKKNTSDIYIYGDIVSYPFLESDVSSHNLSEQLNKIDSEEINVYISSYGGEVAEGLAIYNQLRRHKAKVKTYCDGFACSAASVVFMAGDERIMSNASLLMIHNAWLLTAGDQNALRKDADDLETINQATINAYMNHVSITEDELKAMMDAETWIASADALEMGFATAVVDGASGKKANQSYQRRLVELVLTHRQAAKEPDVAPEPVPEPEPQPEPAPEPEPEPEPQGNKLKNLIAALLAAEEARL